MARLYRIFIKGNFSADIVANFSPFSAVSQWPPKLPSLPSTSGGAADPPPPPAAAAELSEVLVAPSHCHSSAQHSELYKHYIYTEMNDLICEHAFSNLDQVILQLLDPVPLQSCFTGLTGQLEFQRGFKRTNCAQQHKSAESFVILCT